MEPVARIEIKIWLEISAHHPAAANCGVVGRAQCLIANPGFKSGGVAGIIPTFGNRRE
jgi:hypothetical protein